MDLGSVRGSGTEVTSSEVTSSAVTGSAVTGAPSAADAAGAAAAGEWGTIADRAQQALTDRFQSRLFGAKLLRNTAPLRASSLFTFNYWWLAHAVEVRVDGAERRGGRGTLGGPARVRLAQQTYAGIRCRNHGLFNHYFDDMGWLALAALRLYDLTAESRYLDDAVALWQHIADHGAFDRRPDTVPSHGIAWRDSQLDYRNAPTNGAFAILSARLATRSASPRFDDAAARTLDFVGTTFVSGTDDLADLVADGVNRLGDGKLDDTWLFTYNQGLYIGALVEAFDRTGEPDLLSRAARTAAATRARLAPTGLFLSESANLTERGGGDAGLFKGIFFRYLELLLERLGSADDSRMLAAFFTANTDQLRSTALPLASDTWSETPGPTTALSTQLAAVMSLEARARYERSRTA